MASRNSTPSRSRASSNTSSSGDAIMMDPSPPPSRPARLRNPSQTALPTPTPHTHNHNAQPDPSFSLLLSLPRELRDRIYVFALVSDTPFWWPGKSPESGRSDRDNVGVGLLRTSRRVYKECVDILYSQNKFIFTHPSDCNMFRVIASPASVNITSVYFRIRQKDLKLWTTYLGSKQPERSLKSDLPKLKSLWVFLRCGAMGLPAAFGSLPAGPGLLGGIGGQVQAVQNALGQQMHALQQQVQSLTQVMANTGAHVVGGGGGGNHAQPGGSQLPPPPPPAPPIPFMQFAQGALALGAHHQAHQPQPHPANTAPPAQGQQNHPVNVNLLAQQYLQHAQMHQQPNNPPLPLLQAEQHPGSMANTQTRQTTSTTARHDTSPLFSTFIRFERELGLESLCLNLRDALCSQPSTSLDFDSSSSTSSSVAGNPLTASSNKTRPDVKIVCIIHIPRRILERLVALHPDELSVDVETQDARTRFRKVHGIEVSLELNGCPPIRLEPDGTDHDDAFAHEH